MIHAMIIAIPSSIFKERMMDWKIFSKQKKKKYSFCWKSIINNADPVIIQAQRIELL